MHKNQGKKNFSKEELEYKCKISNNFTELQYNLGYNSKGGSRNVSKRLKKYLLLYNIDFSHFDSFYKLRLKRIYPIIEKECSVCKNKFKTEKGSPKEKIYCSKRCANKLNLGKRRSKETNLKVSLVLRKNKPIYEKTCEFCKNIFTTKIEKKVFCNRNCQLKGLWLRPDYRNKVISKIHENVKSGKHQGWKTRNILNYPEKFFKKVLELNGFKNKFITNYPVKKSDLGLKDNACYFLDFYFPEIKLDLEIDGKQHRLLERKESDRNRDLALDKSGYKVYRIEWKSLNKPEGKDFIKKEIEKFLVYLNFIADGRLKSEPVS